MAGILGENDPETSAFDPASMALTSPDTEAASVIGDDLEMISANPFLTAGNSLTADDSTLTSSDSTEVCADETLDDGRGIRADGEWSRRWGRAQGATWSND